MDPNELLRQVEAALNRGRSVEEVNARLREATGGQFSSIGQVRAAAIQAGATAPADASAAPGPRPGSDQSAFAGIGRVGRLAGEVFTLGGMDEAAALAAGVGAAVVPGGKGFSEAREAELRASRQRLQEAEEEAGPGTKAVGFGLGILGPAMPIRAAAAGTKAARTGIPALRGAVTGGAEGAAAGALSADPDPDAPLLENLRERGEAAVVPGAIGTAAGGILGTALAGRAASKAKPTAGERIGEATRRESDLTGRASTVRRDVRRRQTEISRTQFKPLEELGEIEHPAIRRGLQADDVKPVVEDLFPDVAKGERAPTFLELQKIKKRLEGLRDKAARSGDSFELDKFGRAAEEVVDAIGDAIPDRFPQAQRAWAHEAARLRALEDGRRLFTRTADDVEEAFRKLDDPGAQKAFREGLATEFVARVEKLSEPKAILRQIQNSPQLRGKLRVLFGSDDALERFTREALGEERLRNRAHLYERVRRWAGLIAASSAVGNEVAGGILGG